LTILISEAELQCEQALSRPYSSQGRDSLADVA
jgi:hypothetical protein